MSYIPTPGSDIEKVYSLVNGNDQSVADIKIKFDETFREIDIQVLASHLKTLAKRGVILRTKDGNRLFYYRDDPDAFTLAPEPKTPPTLKPINGKKVSANMKLVAYLKSYIGQEITVAEVYEEFDPEKKTSQYSTLLKYGETQGILEKVKQNPLTYRVLPEIGAIEKFSYANARQKQELILAPEDSRKREKKDLSQMTLGDIYQLHHEMEREIERIRNERDRVLAVLQRIGNELHSIAEFK